MVLVPTKIKILRMESGHAGSIEYEMANSTTDEIMKSYKQIREVNLLHYPLWMVKGSLGSQSATVYVDGVTGEVMFQREDHVERSRGIRELMGLAPSSRMIIFYLTTKGLATAEKISEDLKMPLTTVQSNVKELLAKDYLETDGYMFSNKLNLEGCFSRRKGVDLGATERGARLRSCATGRSN